MKDDQWRLRFDARLMTVGAFIVLTTTACVVDKREGDEAEKKGPSFATSDAVTILEDGAVVVDDVVPADDAGPSPNPGKPKPVADDCQSDMRFFVEDVWTQVLAADCASCHSKLGAATKQGAKFVLVDSYQSGFLDANFQTLKKFAEYSVQGKPTLLVKPLGGDGHGGGMRLTEDSPEYAALVEFIERLETEDTCIDKPEALLFDGVDVLDWQGSLRKAVMLLPSQSPTADELDGLVADGPDNEEANFDVLVDKYMDTPEFYLWLKEVFNDIFYSNAYAGGSKAIDLLNEEDFPTKNWHIDCDPNVNQNCSDDSFAALASEYTNWSVSQEILELIVYIVKNDRPFSEILTADYTMVNPFSAFTYGLTSKDVFFMNPTDPFEFRAAKLTLNGQDYPHAGVLSSPLWLNRFPTTPTNVNRHRSRMVFEQFLATDILKLAERPVDSEVITDHNPEVNDPACAVCHVVIDPIAGTFQNWDDEGRYYPPMDGWNPEMAAPGFGEDMVPGNKTDQALLWLAGTISQDHRFATSVVHNMYRAITGMEPVSAPSLKNGNGVCEGGSGATCAQNADCAKFGPESICLGGKEHYSTNLSVYLQQDQYFKTIAEVYKQDENLKTVILSLLKSPYFRAKTIQSNLDQLQEQPGFSEEAHDISLRQVGTSRLLTPEQLERKITSVTGNPWIDFESGKSNLLGKYRIFYGGIDFTTDKQRITEMNGTMANIAERMAIEVACKSVPFDFMQDCEDDGTGRCTGRKLFPYVEWDYTSLYKGYEVPGLAAQIKKNIIHLHAHLLNETVTEDSVEFQESYALYNAVLEMGQELIEGDETALNLPVDCAHYTEDPDNPEDFLDAKSLIEDPDYTVRAWMALVSYMLSDYRFLYQ